MADKTLPPIDLLFPVDITPVIYYLENDKGLDQEQIIKWFKKNNPEYHLECEQYFKAINAGEPNPLQIPFSYSD